MKTLLNTLNTVTRKIQNETVEIIDALKPQPQEIIDHANAMVLIDHRGLDKSAFEEVIPEIVAGGTLYVFGRCVVPKIFNVKEKDIKKHQTNQNVFAGIYGFGICCKLAARVSEIREVKQSLMQKEITTTSKYPTTEVQVADKS